MEINNKYWKKKMITQNLLILKIKLFYKKTGKKDIIIIDEKILEIS